MRRVLLVSPVGQVGGGEQVLLALARSLGSFGYYPILACMRPGPLTSTAQGLGITAFEFEFHRYRSLLKLHEATQWLNSIARKNKVSLIHSNHTGHIYGGRVARRLKIPEVWHLYDYPGRFDLVDQINRLIPTDHVIFMTAHTASGFTRLKCRPHSIIPPTCLTPTQSATATEGDARARLNIPPGAPLLLTVARLQPHKGHSHLIEAARLVTAIRPDARFVITGSATDSTQQQYLNSLQRLVRQHDLEEHVRFIGFVPDSELAALYRDATCLVHPAITEGYGLVLVEAMGAGLPVIAAAAEGPSSIIIDGQNGLLVPTKSGQALADAVLRLLSDQQTRLHFAAAGRLMATQGTIENMTNKVSRIYNTLLAST